LRVFYVIILGTQSRVDLRGAARVELAWMLRVGSIVLCVDDLRRQTEFWAEALNYVPAEGDGDDFVLLHPRGATEVRWSKRPTDSDFLILADPEGSRFCVADASP
jgi:hypothetical protein